MPEAVAYAILRSKLVEGYLHRLEKMGMRHSVERRVLLLDPGVVRWALSARQEMLVPGLRQKDLLRPAVAPVLPSYALDRPKQGFCPPVTTWAEERLSSRGPLAEGLLFDAGLPRHDAISLARECGARDSFAARTLGTLVEWSNRSLRVASIAELEEVPS